VAQSDRASDFGSEGCGFESLEARTLPLSLRPWHRAGLVLALAGTAAASLAWLCTRDPDINFLPGDKRAAWILFPTPVDARTHPTATLDTTFRRVFTLDNQPRTARLNVRAAKRVDLKINGASIGVDSSRNWKNVATVDVLAFLRTGTNAIEARVFNDNAPPSLWLALSADQLTLRSDQTWEASFTGSSWHGAALASTPRFPGAGSLVAGGERTLDAFARIWRIWLVFGGIALAIWSAGYWWLLRSRTTPAIMSGRLSRWPVIALLLVIASSWLILFWNNSGLLPFYAGFDSRPHLEYIKYIQERRALPLLTEGSEMFQPPLYYILSASVLSSCGLSATDTSGILMLRLMTMLFGITHFVLVFLSLRLLFPTRLAPQLVGLVLAAFLPMQLYLSHYVTNETLAATLVAAAVYFGLRLLRTKNASGWGHAWLGLFLGAAILTKTTAILLIPSLFAALIIKLAVQRSPVGVWLRTVGITLAVCLTFCGWHYIRIWHRFGTPFLGNWDAASGFSWWQDPGYRTAGDYARFGQSLIAPLFSGFGGFADGIYSTLWGDALCGGISDVIARPPWNYDLVVAGYLLAMAPTLLIMAGAGIALFHYIRKPSTGFFLLLGFSATVVTGMIFMTLKVASYAQVKAFYGLSLLVPLCFFGATGWDALTRRHKLLQFALGTILLVWAINSFASVWIRHSAPQQLYVGVRLAIEHKLEAAASEMIKAVNSNPSNATARRSLGFVLDELGRPAQALEQAERATELSPMDSACHLQLGSTLAKQGQIERAITEARRAVDLGPENPYAYDLLFASLGQSGRNAEAIGAARDGLSVSPFNAELHYRLGLAAGQEADFVTAINQFAYALLLQPDRSELESKLHLTLLLMANTPDASKQYQEAASAMPDAPKALNDLAWLLATHPDETLRNGREALRLAERACALTSRKMPKAINTLAAAYAETGRFLDAINTTQEALALARSSGDADAATLSQNLLSSFKANRPYREDPIRK
jgi:tetratricopeptide (TPR) repeat protein